MEIILGVVAAAALVVFAAVLVFYLRMRWDAAASRIALANADRLRHENITAVKEAAHAASLEAAQSVSSKLLDDHKRESEAAKETARKLVGEISEDLVKRVESITKNVAQLAGQLEEKGRTLDTIWRALQSPSGAGQMSEIGLANTLASFGLEQGRDFVLQQTTIDEETGRRLRPDAVVFLPGNSVLVIDSKASKFLIDIARAEGTEGEQAAYQNLARSMNQHLRSLMEKDYANAIRAAWRQAGYEQDIARILSVMYLPNEGALEKLNRADPEFIRRAREAQIIPAGPAGLHCAVSLASIEINRMRQVENQKHIAEMTQSLVDSVIVMLRHAAAVGRGLKQAADNFARLTGSANQRVIPRMRSLVKLGLPTAQAMPGAMPAFGVHTDDHLIEAEAEEIGEAAAPHPAPRLVK
jgi:DNA recombination protein RmuC